MEDTYKPVCSIYLTDTKDEDGDNENVCKVCNKKVKCKNYEEKETCKTVQQPKKNLTEYIYQSTNAICLQNPSLYYYQPKVPNYYLKQSGTVCKIISVK